MCTFLDDGPQPLSEAHDAKLFHPAVEAALLETEPDLVEGTKAAQQVATNQLTQHERSILQRAAEKDLVDTASEDVAMSGRVKEQLFAARENRQKGIRAQTDAQKLVDEDDRQMEQLKADVKAKKEQLLRAEANAPHLELLEL